MEVVLLRGTTYLLTRFDGEVKMVQDVWQLGLNRDRTLVIEHGSNKAIQAHSISNDEVLALDFSFLWPRWVRAWLNELGRLAGKFGVFADSFQSDLRRTHEVCSKFSKRDLYHRLFQANKSPDLIYGVMSVGTDFVHPLVIGCGAPRIKSGKKHKLAGHL